MNKENTVNKGKKAPKRKTIKSPFTSKKKLKFDTKSNLFDALDIELATFNNIDVKLDKLATTKGTKERRKLISEAKKYLFDRLNQLEKINKRLVIKVSSQEFELEENDKLIKRLTKKTSDKSTTEPFTQVDTDEEDTDDESQWIFPYEVYDTKEDKTPLS